MKLKSTNNPESVMNILLVDDDAMMTQLLSHKLSSHGYCVETAATGWDALHNLSAKKYDLLITDLMMPDISGLTLISLLKNYVFEKMPVIIITSLDQPTSILSGIGMGVLDYFTKPINVDKLIERIDSISTAKPN
ncbi:MAG TPA: response regulator transcription factor [Bacteroidia bacterium]|jgi:DNA-binding response OmpR family regulator|nr:response regulator transcription factor [Bacteroidia bacterium]